jgi:hypothetical protein
VGGGVEFGDNSWEDAHAVADFIVEATPGSAKLVLQCHSCNVFDDSNAKEGIDDFTFMVTVMACSSLAAAQVLLPLSFKTSVRRSGLR